MTTRYAAGHRRAWSVALTVTIGLVLGACSSVTDGVETSSGDASSTTSTTPSGSVVPGTTPESTEAPGTTVAASPEAVAATLTADDLGGTWVVYPSDAPVYGEGSEAHCTNATGLVDDLADGSKDEGAILQMGDRMVFAQSSSWVFATPAEAQEFASYLLTDEYAACRRAELDAGAAESDPSLSVQSTGTTSGDGTSPYLGSISFEMFQVVDGTPQPVGAGSQHAIYVAGATVIDLFSQLAFRPGDPDDLPTTSSEELDRGMDIVLARVSG